jgi:hypothetical protein
MAVHMSCIYGNKQVETWFQEAYKSTGAKLDMGKSCIRFKKLQDLPLEIIGKAIASTPVKGFIALCEKNLK